MRTTIRFNEKEEADLNLLKQYVHEEDISKIVKFAISTAVHHIKIVTDTFVGPEYDVAFIKKRKTAQMKRRLYE